MSPARRRSWTSRLTSFPSESMTENDTLAGFDRSKPTVVTSRKPSPFGENELGVAAKRRTSGNSPLSRWVAKKAPMVARTISAKAARTRGLPMAGETVVGGRAPARLAQNVVRMRVQIVDPRGDVTPYDHALSGALARRGAEVELVTSRFVYGPTPELDGYAVSERFYRHAVKRGLERRRSRQALRLLEHVPDMLRYRRHA